MSENFYIDRAKKSIKILQKYCWKQKGTCKICKRKNVKIGTKKICPDCAAERMGKAAHQMVEHKGHYFRKWQRNILKGVKKIK